MLETAEETARPTPEEIRELAEWRPAAGVLSVYLHFDPNDRAGSWRTELRHGLDCVLEEMKDATHERRIAMQATLQRLRERFEDEQTRPPPRGEAGFLEVAEKSGTQRWWATAVPPISPATVVLAEHPVVAPLVDVCHRSEECGIAVVSAERVRLLRFTEESLEQLEDWELSVTSLDWRERKSASSSNPASTQGASSSGHDQYGERLEHNRRRFLAESAHLAAERLGERGLADVVVFGPASEADAFASALSAKPIHVDLGDGADLISIPTGQLLEPVTAAITRLASARDREVVERALGEAAGGRPGARGIQETTEALAEGRVQHLVFNAALGEPAEALVRGALTCGALIAVARGEAAERLKPAGGVAAILRY